MSSYIYPNPHTTWGVKLKCKLWTVGDYNASKQGGYEKSLYLSLNFAMNLKRNCSLTTTTESSFKGSAWDFPGGLVVKNMLSNAGDLGSIPGQGSYMPWGN